MADDIAQASLATITREFGAGTVVKQAVTVCGTRMIGRREVEDIGPELAIVRARIDLQDTFDVWLSINAPVSKWRKEPMIDYQRDLMHDYLVVQIYVRGWLDIDVRLADHRAWLVELP